MKLKYINDPEHIRPKHMCIHVGTHSCIHTQSLWKQLRTLINVVSVLHFLYSYFFKKLKKTSRIIHNTKNTLVSVKSLFFFAET